MSTSNIFIGNKLIRVSFWLLKLPNIEQLIQKLFSKHASSLNEDGFLKIPHDQKETTLKPLIRAYLEQLGSSEKKLFCFMSQRIKKEQSYSIQVHYKNWLKTDAMLLINID